MRTGATPAQIVFSLFDRLRTRWAGKIEEVRLWPTPSFRLRFARGGSDDSAESEVRIFPRPSACITRPSATEPSNVREVQQPAGHGHNYEVQVTLTGTTGPIGCAD